MVIYCTIKHIFPYHPGSQLDPILTGVINSFRNNRLFGINHNNRIYLLQCMNVSRYFISLTICLPYF